MSDMSRKEAIEYLIGWDKALEAEGNSPFSDARRALAYGIHSLETDEAYNLMYEQPEFCADALSRKELLKKWEETTPRGRTEFDQIIMTMPSVIPEIK